MTAKLNWLGIIVATVVAFFTGFLWYGVLFEAIWKDRENMNDAAVVAEVLYAAGLDGAAIAEIANSEEAKAALKDATERAVERGAFGAPTFFIGDEMHFGQDRLDFVEEAIAA